MGDLPAIVVAVVNELLTAVMVDVMVVVLDGTVVNALTVLVVVTTAVIVAVVSAVTVVKPVLITVPHERPAGSPGARLEMVGLSTTCLANGASREGLVINGLVRGLLNGIAKACPVGEFLSLRKRPPSRDRSPARRSEDRGSLSPPQEVVSANSGP